MDYSTEQQTELEVDIFYKSDDTINEKGENIGNITYCIEYDVIKKVIIATIIESNYNEKWKETELFRKEITFQEMFNDKIDMSKMFPQFINQS